MPVFLYFASTAGVFCIIMEVIMRTIRTLASFAALTIYGTPLGEFRDWRVFAPLSAVELNPLEVPWMPGP